MHRGMGRAPSLNLGSRFLCPLEHFGAPGHGQGTYLELGVQVPVPWNTFGAPGHWAGHPTLNLGSSGAQYFEPKGPSGHHTLK